MNKIHQYIRIKIDIDIPKIVHAIRAKMIENDNDDQVS